MDQIPPLAWVAIAFVLIIMIGVNVSMFNMLRDPNKLRKEARSRRASGTLGMMQKASDVLKNPFAGESQQLDELSKRVRGLGETPGGPSAEEKEHRNPPEA